jgi:inner membrane protein
MASAITHFIVGAALALPAVKSRAIRRVLSPAAIPITCGLLALAPDLDTFAMRVFGIPHGSLLAHRGFFHSPLILILFTALLAAVVARRSLRAFAPLAALWACSAITHPLLDMLTDGGGGVMLLFPFSEARLFFPWHPIRVSPLGIQRFFTGGRARRVLMSELPFCFAALAIGIVGLVARRPMPSKASQNV